MRHVQRLVSGPLHPLCGLFGLRVRALRNAAGLSQDALAHRADLDRSYVGQVERGEVNISLINIGKLSEGLGVEPSILFAFDAGARGKDPAEERAPRRSKGRRT